CEALSLRRLTRRPPLAFSTAGIERLRQFPHRLDARSPPPEPVRLGGNPTTGRRLPADAAGAWPRVFSFRCAARSSTGSLPSTASSASDLGVSNPSSNHRVGGVEEEDNKILGVLCFVANWKKEVVADQKQREVHACSKHKETLKKISYGDILKATNWFSSLHTISSTCTGSVYVGRFKSDRSLVAIKVFNLNEPGGYDSYFIECEVLRSTRHRNIMRPMTLCSTLDSQNHDFKALIFRFMVNGSVDRWLHSEQHNGIPDRVLNFGQRICIAADVASALDYVHNQLTPPLIHCDLKPHNILLDDDMAARLSDFGSAKFLLPGQVIRKSLVDVGGIIGYMAPEYGLGCKISVGGDVYSFGVLLLELLTGKRPTDDMFVDGLTLRIFSESMFPDLVAEMLDPHMAHEEHQGCVEAWMQRYIVPLVALGLSCTVESPKDRPGMKDVPAKLSALRDDFLERHHDD
ncbi:probable LRR receptor-like serine/threonine-protein kinase At3g47570, partial [Hordeum vulgare subsp. vulgare]